jgi:hypothetical protein
MQDQSMAREREKKKLQTKLFGQKELTLINCCAPEGDERLDGKRTT